MWDATLIASDTPGSEAHPPTTPDRPCHKTQDARYSLIEISADVLLVVIVVSGAHCVRPNRKLCSMNMSWWENEEAIEILHQEMRLAEFNPWLSPHTWPSSRLPLTSYSVSCLVHGEPQCWSRAAGVRAGTIDS